MVHREGAVPRNCRATKNNANADNIFSPRAGGGRYRWLRFIRRIPGQLTVARKPRRRDRRPPYAIAAQCEDFTSPTMFEQAVITQTAYWQDSTQESTLLHAVLP